MSKKIIYILSGIGLIVATIFFMGNNKVEEIDLSGKSSNIQEVKKVENLDLRITMKTTRGDINLKLFPEVAPFTTVNMVTLASNGFYDGLKFHRVISDFMIQGGDPTGTGAGGPGYKFKDEFNKDYTFNRPGILAMANSGPNTNGSQFFITHVETPWLNMKHTIFGEVVSSQDQDVVNAIKQGDIINSIVVTGDVDSFLEQHQELVSQIKEAIGK